MSLHLQSTLVLVLCCVFTNLKQFFSKEKYIIILGPWITAVGAWVPVSQLAEEEVAAYRQLEEERIAKVLDDLLEICQSQKVESLLPFHIFFFVIVPTCQCRHEPFQQSLGSTVFR